MRTIQCFVVGLALAMLTNVCFAEEFPYRKDYPDVPIVEIADLKAGYDDGSFLIVDVRSTIEYETIHPKGALHVSLSSANFIDNLRKVIEMNPGRKIATYCNGITCLKSYKAAQSAVDAGMKNVYAFDAGIPAWANAYPGDTLLVGKPIIDPEKQLIPKSEFKKKALAFEDFKKKAAESGTQVVDARDPIQRVGRLPGLEGALPIPLDKLIKNIISHDRMKDKQLVIFDQVGKQVRWVMYHLEDRGYKNYYFLKGGATAVLGDQKYRSAGVRK